MIRIRYRLYVCMMAAALLLPSCTDDWTEQDTIRHEVQVAFTRSSTIDGAWADGDAVKLFVTSSGETTQEILTYKEGGWDRTSLRTILPASITAVYPSSIGALDSFTIPTDQSDAAKLRQADYLTSDAQTVDYSNALSLNMTLQHRLCKIIISNVEFEGWGNLDHDINNFGIRSYSRITNANGTFTPEGDVVDVTPFHDSENGSYTAIVSPVPGEPLIAVRVEYMWVYATTDITFEPGKSYSFTLKITPKVLTLSLDQIATIPGWSEDKEQKI